MLELHYHRPAIYRFVEAAGRRPDLLLDGDLRPGDLVFDVGAYLGEWCGPMAERHPDVRIAAFEPVPQSHRRLSRAMAGHPNVFCLPYGLGARDEMVTMALAGGGSSTFGHEASFGDVDAPLRDIDAVLDELGVTQIDLMKINIEGGEYDLLERLDECGWLPHIRQFSIQFHEWIPGAYRRRAAIRRALRRHHDETWNHPWVWEFWTRRPGAPAR